MSTSYYYLRAPLTSVRLEERGGHDVVTVWENRANAGTLTLSKGIGSTLVRMFTDHDGEAPIQTHWGGKDVGTVVTEGVRGLDPALVLVSEYGEPLTVAEIRARAGAGKGTEGIGRVGELFGYAKDLVRGTYPKPSE